MRMEVISSGPLATRFNNNNAGEFLADEEALAVEALAKRLADELKSAKRAHLACGEVLLPANLTRALAHDVHRLAESEPYGLKGCTICVQFESGDPPPQDQHRLLSVINCDPTTPTTFQLVLTLKQAANGWNHFLPQFIKKMTRGSGTVMISPEYGLVKRKLYRSYDE